jgi:hypothetical protein
MTMTMTTPTAPAPRRRLAGPHPYLPGEETVISVAVSAFPPGETVTCREIERAASGTYTRPGRHWVALAGPYRIAPGIYGATKRKRDRVYQPLADRETAALIAALWDLQGRPTHIGAARRRAANIALVETVDGLTIYRCAAEVAVVSKDHYAAA